MLRTHTCGQLRKENIGETVQLCGWVHSRRDHGGVIFIDLRDRYGLTQLKFDPEINKIAWEKAEKLRNEWVLQVSGKVVARPKEMLNKKLETGEIEIQVLGLEILNSAKTPPFELDEEKAEEANENLRLKYRFIDLRRKKVQEMLKKKDEIIQYIRGYFQARGFIEVQTPILANSSPEGARDFLVPSRLHSGKFYALPQAPQQFKQLLMVGGIDKYFQIAPCFRDEDPRMDRHYGEFYQLDMEMSFVEQEDIFRVMEPLMIELVEKFTNKKNVNLTADNRFVQIPYQESMIKYGCDKPDLRFDLEIKPITDLVVGCGFKVFADMASQAGHVVHALKVDGGGKFTRKEIDDLTKIAQDEGAKGLAYIVIKENNELQSPIVKFLGEELCQKIVSFLEAKSGDIIFFGADKFEIVCKVLGTVRNVCADKLGLKDKNKVAWAWIVDFPMYEYSEIEEGRIDFGHNPFSMPKGGLEALNAKNPFDIIAQQFDLVLNGFEVSSGGIRNHNLEIMYKAFSIAGYDQEEVKKRFGGMLRAFEYGAPPHGGNAPGLDRLIMILNDCNSIRDMYAFPKDGRGRDLMMDSPGEVNKKQLKELGLK